jgi:hypothetical protein
MTGPGSDRERLRQTFNLAAGPYLRARPGYPSEVFDDLITVAGPAAGEKRSGAERSKFPQIR